MYSHGWNKCKLFVAPINPSRGTFLSTRPTRLGEPPPVSLLPWSKWGLVIASAHSPNLFRRNRLTGSDNTTFESKVEGKALQREIEVYRRSFFQIPHDCTVFTHAQLIRTPSVHRISLPQDFPSTQLSKEGLPSHTSPYLWYRIVVANAFAPSVIPRQDDHFKQIFQWELRH